MVRNTDAFDCTGCGKWHTKRGGCKGRSKRNVKSLCSPVDRKAKKKKKRKKIKLNSDVDHVPSNHQRSPLHQDCKNLSEDDEIDFAPLSLEQPPDIHRNDWLKFAATVLSQAKKYKLSRDATEAMLKLHAVSIPELKDKSLGIIEQLLEIDQSNLPMYTMAVCPSCASLYSLDDLQRNPVCSHVAFPTGVASSCQTALGYQVSKSGKLVWKPFKSASFGLIVEQLRSLFGRPNFEEKIEMWRNRAVDGHFSDIFDGKKK